MVFILDCEETGSEAIIEDLLRSIYFTKYFDIFPS